MQAKSYSRFWRKIHKTAKDKGVPLRVMFELTYRCNFRCKHCYVPESYKSKAKHELKTSEVFSILDQLVDIGCFYLGFTGGEPFLREDIFDILRRAKKRGFQVIVYTNGSLINEAMADELRRLNLNKVDITLPAMSEASFERISQVSGSRDKVFKAIELLHKKRVKLGFKTCLLKENESEIKDIRSFADSLGALHRLDPMLLPRLDGDKKPYRYRGSMRQIVARSPGSAEGGPAYGGHKVTSKDRFRDCGLALQDSQLPTPNSQLHTIFKCGVGVGQAAITPFGELKLCLMIDYPKYKILENGLKAAWQKLKDLASGIKPDKSYQCDKCEFQAYCKWCPAKSWLYNRTFTACDPVGFTRAKKFSAEDKN